MSTWGAAVWLLMLGVLLAVAYHNSYKVPFLLDDQIAIVENPTLGSLTSSLFPPTNSGSTVSGRPLLNLSLAINRIIGGDSPGSYHVGNLLIHFGATLCLFLLIRRTLRLPVLAPRFGANATSLAGVSTALWALHPLQTESVTYIIQRAESLVGLCFLFTLYAFVRTAEKPSLAWSLLTCAGCFLGMAAKEVMAVAPVLILLYDRTFLSGSFGASWQCRRHLYVAFGLSWLLLLTLVISSGGRGETAGFGSISWLGYLTTQGPGIAGYLLRALVPMGLIFDHGPVLIKELSPIVWGVALVALLVVLTGVLLVRRPQAGYLGAWFFLILAPTSSIIPIASQTLAEHRMYLPLAAVVVALVLFVYSRFGRSAWVLLPLLVVTYVGLTIDRNNDYRSAISIWEDTVHKRPQNPRAEMNYGSLLLHEGRHDEAIEHLRKALELNPAYATAAANLGKALLAKAAAQPASSSHPLLMLQGLDCLRQASDMSPDNPQLMTLLGSSLLEAGRSHEALPVLQRAVSLWPDNAAAHADLARAFAALNRDTEAERCVLAALHHEPTNASYLSFYGSILRRMNRLPESLEKLRAAVRLQPGLATAHSQLGMTLMQVGQNAEALQEFTEALRLDASLPTARHRLALLLGAEGRNEEAIAQLVTLLRQTPPTAEILCHLGVLCARTGRQEEALMHAKNALAIEPNHPQSLQLLAMLQSAPPAPSSR